MRIVSAFGRAYLLANLPVKLGCRQSLIQIASYPANSSTASGQSGTEDIGCIYKVPDEDVNNLLLRENLPSVFAKQLTTLRECAWLCRKPLIEIKNCLRIVNCDTPNLRIVLWGKFGSGKTITLYQALHYAYSKEWIIFCVRSAMYLTRRAKEIQMSSYRSGRIDCPHQAVQLLQKFKTNNARNWNKLANLMTGKDYIWTKVEKTPKGRPITDIVEMGLSAPFIASDCIGALLRELKEHSTSGAIRLLVAIDDANSLYGRTLVRRADKTYAKPNDLTLVHHLRKLFEPNWSNGACVLVADKKEVSDARDTLTIPRITPLELFGEEGFEAIDPFVPVEVGLYSEKEIQAIYDYYLEKNWITSKLGRSERGRKEMMYLSAFNPYNYERLCAIV